MTDIDPDVREFLEYYEPYMHPDPDQYGEPSCFGCFDLGWAQPWGYRWILAWGGLFKWHNLNRANKFRGWPCTSCSRHRIDDILPSWRWRRHKPLPDSFTDEPPW